MFNKKEPEYPQDVNQSQEVLNLDNNQDTTQSLIYQLDNNALLDRIKYELLMGYKAVQKTEDNNGSTSTWIEWVKDKRRIALCNHICADKLILQLTILDKAAALSSTDDLLRNRMMKDYELTVDDILFNHRPHDVDPRNIRSISNFMVNLGTLALNRSLGFHTFNQLNKRIIAQEKTIHQRPLPPQKRTWGQFGG